MKVMTCNQLGGACDEQFEADTFEEMANQAQKHGMQMLATGDNAHMKVMIAMKEKMENPEEMEKWMDEKRKEFDSLD